MICFFVHNWHYLPLIEPTLLELRRRGRSYSILVLRHPDDRYFESLGVWKVKHPELRGFVDGSATVRLLRLFSKVPFVGDLCAARLTRNFARRFLKKQKSEVLVTTDDRAIFYPLAVLAAASSLGVKSILYPVETIMFVEALLDDKAAIRPGKGIARHALRACIRLLYPSNIRTRQGVDVHFYIPKVLAPFLVWRSILPRTPWIRGSHPALACVAVNAQRQIDENESEGLSRNRMELTGLPPHDRFAHLAEDREDLRKKFDQTWVGTAGKPLFLLVGTHFTGEFTAEELKGVHVELREMLSTIARDVPTEYTIVLKLHPKNDPGEWKEFLSGFGRDIVILQHEWDVYSLIAVADAVCLFTSSAVLACMGTEVPVIVYKLRFPSFESFYAPYKSVCITRSPQDLSLVLRNFERSVDRVARLRDRATLGMFDGKSAARCAALIERFLPTT